MLRWPESAERPIRFHVDDHEYLVEDILDQNAYILRYGGNEDE